MANTVGGARENLMAARTQKNLMNTLVAREVTSFEENNRLVNGQSINRPQKSRFKLADYTVLTDVTAQGVTFTQELLTVDQSKVVSFEFDPIQDMQIWFKVENEFTDEASYALRNDIDGKILSEVSNALYTIDAGTFGGTSGTAINLNDTNIDDIFRKARATLISNGVEAENICMLISPDMEAEFVKRGVASLFQTADSMWNNGYTGKFAGMDVYVSQNLSTTQSITYSGTNPSDGDTVVVVRNGETVTFTFKTALTPAAGEVLIGAAADDSATNLVAAINGSAGEGTTYSEISADDRAMFSQQRFSASVATGSNTITITTAGVSTYSETGSQYTIGTQSTNAIVMRKGAIDAVVQMEPSVEINKNPKNRGYTVLMNTLYGVKTFLEGRRRMAKVAIKSA